MLKMIKTFAYITMLVATSTSTALAHTGHDHGHWSSSLVHTLFYLSLAAVSAACVFAGYKTYTRKQSSSK